MGIYDNYKSKTNKTKSIYDGYVSGKKPINSTVKTPSITKQRSLTPEELHQAEISGYKPLDISKQNPVMDTARNLVIPKPEPMTPLQEIETFITGIPKYIADKDLQTKVAQEVRSKTWETVGKVAKPLDAPMNAARSMVKASQELDTGNFIQNLKNIPAEIEAYKKGFTGETQTNIRELMPEFYKAWADKHKVAGAIADFGLDILSNPTTWMGFGLGDIASKAMAKNASKLLSKGKSGIDIMTKVAKGEALSEVEESIIKSVETDQPTIPPEPVKPEVNIQTPSATIEPPKSSQKLEALKKIRMGVKEGTAEHEALSDSIARMERELQDEITTPNLQQSEQLAEELRGLNKSETLPVSIESVPDNTNIAAPAKNNSVTSQIDVSTGKGVSPEGHEITGYVKNDEFENWYEDRPDGIYNVTVKNGKRTEYKVDEEQALTGDAFGGEKISTSAGALKREGAKKRFDVIKGGGNATADGKVTMAEREISTAGKDALISKREVKAYMFENPEVKPYFQDYAEYILGNEFVPNEQLGRTTEIMQKLKADTGLTPAVIKDALERLVKNHGQENAAAAKRVEIVIDDMLTNGFNSVHGDSSPPIENYLKLKSEIEGREIKPVVKTDTVDDLPVDDNNFVKPVERNVPEKIKSTDQIGIAGVNVRDIKGKDGSVEKMLSPYGQAWKDADGWKVDIDGKTSKVGSEAEARTMIDSGIERTEVKAKKVEDSGQRQMDLQLFSADEEAKKVSQFRTNTIERSTMLEDAKDFLPEDDFKYSPQEVKDWEAAAELNVRSNPELVKSKILKSKQLDKVQEYEAAMISGQLLKEAEKTGKYGELTDWLKNVAAKTREVARALKAVDTAWTKSPEKILKKAAQIADENMTPDVAKRIENYLNGLKDGTIKTKDIKILDALKTGNADFLRRLVEAKFKVAIPDELAAELIADAKKLQEISDKGFDNLMDQTELMARINFKMNSLQKVSIAEKVASFNYIQQLFNTVTQIRNIIGNEAMYRGNRMAKYFATAIDFANSNLFGKERTISFAKNFNPWSSVKLYWKDVSKGAKSGYEGYQLYGVSDVKFFGSGKKFTGKWNPFNYMESILGASLKGFDYAAYMRGTRDAVYELAVVQARNQGIKVSKKVIQDYMDNLSREALEIAEETGRYLTLQDQNVASNLLNQAKNAFNNIGIGPVIEKGGQKTRAFGAGNLILNYAQSTGALIKSAFDFSPGGIVEGMLELTRPLISKTGLMARPTADTYKKMITSFSRGIVGTVGLTGMGYHLASVGVLTGNTTDDPDAAALENEMGMGKYKINMTALYRYVSSGFNRDEAKSEDGDFLYSYDWIQPLATSVGFGANLQQNLVNNKNATAGIGGTLLSSIDSATQAITDQPILQGLTRFARGYDAGKTLKEMGQGLLTGLTGSYLNQARKITDNVRRNTKGEDAIAETVNLIKNKIPGLSKQLPEVYTTTGKLSELYQGGDNNPLVVLFSPGFISHYDETPGTKLLLDLYKSTGETKQFPRAAAKSITYKAKGWEHSKKVTLTPYETGKLQQVIGERTIYILTLLSKDMTVNRLDKEIKLTGKNVFSKMTDDEKVEAIYQTLNTVGDYGKEEMIRIIGKSQLESRAK